ncbi:MAG: glycoside hydrolase family 65 protein [Paludibacteraceae bacterium]|nr:glycoside hydrolase family 65 protein [Paludibacteraceae bacterium]
MKRNKVISFFLLFTPLAMAQSPWVISVDQPLKGDYFGITSANGQIGLVSSRSPLEVDKVVVGGLYDIYGSGRVNNYFPNINPLDIELRVNGERLNRRNIRDYHQEMNLHNAAFRGSFTYQDKVRVQYTIVALRQMPFGYMTDVRVEVLQECRMHVTNQHRTPEALREPHAYFTQIDNKANPLYKGSYPHYRLMTTTALSPTGRYELSATTAFLFPHLDSNGLKYANIQIPDITHREDRGVGRQTMEFEQSLHPGDTLHFCLVGNIMGSNVMPDTRNETERLTVYQLLEGYDRLWKRHNDAWNDLWTSDILVEGDEQAQQDIHAMLYHHYAFYRDDNPASCSPMGLSGLGYNGHAFWDSETWMFPVLLLMRPQMAKMMLQYRFDRLPMAKKRAYIHGYKGAMFPWESADTGQEETSPNNMYPSTENHITADVAIACWQYFCLTQDKDWLLATGWPVIRETADFWASRIEPDGQIINCIGADEWSRNPYGGKQVDNNAYTIGAAKTNLQYALSAAKVLGIKTPQEWTEAESRLHWKYLSDNVIAVNETYDGQVTKQADVILLAYPLHLLTDPGEIERNIAYYKSKVPDKQTPAMSKSIYAVIYSRMGKADEALYYWRDSYLPNLNPPFRVIAEFNGGTNPYFITGAGGTLQSLLFGFAGLDITDKGLKQNYKPILPPEWSQLIIRRKGQKDIVVK